MVHSMQHHAKDQPWLWQSGRQADVCWGLPLLGKSGRKNLNISTSKSANDILLAKSKWSKILSIRSICY